MLVIASGSQAVFPAVGPFFVRDLLYLFVSDWGLRWNPTFQSPKTFIYLFILFNLYLPRQAMKKILLFINVA